MVAQGNDSIVYGESVHRQEFGIDKGTFEPNRRETCLLPHGSIYGKKISHSYLVCYT
jgi:hypothetical protein